MDLKLKSLILCSFFLICSKLSDNAVCENNVRFISRLFLILEYDDDNRSAISYTVHTILYGICIYMLNICKIRPNYSDIAQI